MTTIAVIALLLVCVLLLRRRITTLESLLGRDCVVTDNNRTYLAVCVAVSWHGSIAVRGLTSANRKTVWIDRRDVGEQVRWL